MRRYQQYRPLMPAYSSGGRQMRHPYVHVQRRTRKLSSPKGGLAFISPGDSDVFRIGGGFTLGTVVFLGIMGVIAWRAFDYAATGK